MPGYSYVPIGAAAAYMGMMGHLGPVRESRGGSGFGAASYGMYGGAYGGRDGGRRAPRSDSYGYGPSAQSSGIFSYPYGSGLWSSTASSSRSPYGSSYGSGSSYDSPSLYGLHSSYDSARSFMTDYRPRSGWFSKRRSGNDYPPFHSDFARGGGSGRRQSYPRASERSRWSFGSW